KISPSAIGSGKTSPFRDCLSACPLWGGCSEKLAWLKHKHCRSSSQKLGGNRLPIAETQPQPRCETFEYLLISHFNFLLCHFHCPNGRSSTSAATAQMYFFRFCG
ncbi:GD17829, partial [Drosophila simulans]